MKNNNKKGFTIVELVIVIAVIAILAAVLIPTFASIVKKANIAADTQLAKNLNTALTTAAIGADAPADFSEVLKALRDNGFIISNINPTTEGWYYVWESDSNQILLVDGDNNYEIKYQSKEIKAENQTPGKTWNFAVSDASKVDTIKALGSDGNRPYVVYSPKTTEDLMSAFGDAYKEGGIISVSADIVLGEDDKPFMDTDAAGKSVTVDLSGNVLTNTGYWKYNADGGDYNFGQLTTKAGTLKIVNGMLETAGNAKYVVAAVDSGKVELEGVTINDSVEGGAALRILGADAVMNVKNTTINLTSQTGCGGEFGKGNAIFDNVTITINSSEKNWLNVCVTPSKGGKLTINSGTYTAKGEATAVLGLWTTAGNYVINGGNFVAEGNANIFAPHHVDTDTFGTEHTIELNGGTFTVGGKTVDISTLTEANYESEIKSLFGNGNYTDIMNNLTVSKTANGYKVVIK